MLFSGSFDGGSRARFCGFGTFQSWRPDLAGSDGCQNTSPKFRKSTVAFVKTTPFARPKELSPNPGHGHHWFGNAESYFLIGDALGKAMVKLLGAAETN